MFDFLKHFRKNNLTKTDLETALKQGLITEEELLRLRRDRADKDLEDFLKSHKKEK